MIPKNLDRTYIIVNRCDRKNPMLVVAPSDRRKSKALARRLSGNIADVAIVVDSTPALYKGGERRV